MCLTTSALSKVAVIISKDLTSYGLRSPSKNFLLSAPIPTPWLGTRELSVEATVSAGPSWRTRLRCRSRTTPESPGFCPSHRSPRAEGTPKQRGRGRGSGGQVFFAPRQASQHLGNRQDGEQEEKGPVGIKPGLALTSCPRPTLTVAEALLLPPLLLTSTSLCRKVDLAPRLSQRLSVVKGVMKSET